MSLIYAVISFAMLFGYIKTGNVDFAKVAMVYTVFQIIGELVSGIAGYWIGRQKLIDKMIEQGTDEHAYIKMKDREVKL